MAGSDTDRAVITAFRSGGEVPGMHRARLLLLSTTGAVSGERRTTPLMRIALDDRLYVVASNDGATKPPSWFGNLRAHPQVHVELDERESDARAVVLDDGEREAVWGRIVDALPFFAEHPQRAGRPIPVVELQGVRA